MQGFPTLKIVRPGKKVGRPTVEDYQGQRSAKAIVDAVKDKIPNHVKRLTDKDVEEWMQTDKQTPKAVLFSDKGTTSALLKALAIDYLGSVDVAQIRNNQKQAVETYQVKTYPTFMLFPGEGKDSIVYDGEMTKEGLSKFLSQVATTNPDPAPAKPKAAKSSSKDSKKASEDSSSFASASKSHKSADSSASKATQTAETLQDDSNPTESPNPNVVTDETQKPIQLDVAPPLPSLDDSSSLQQSCLTTKSHLCVLALLPKEESEASTGALQHLAEIHYKHVSRKGKISSFYAIPPTNTLSLSLRSAISVPADTLAFVAVNGKKNWAKVYSGTEFTRSAVEDWVDAIRMGEGKKISLPEGLVVEGKEEKVKEEVKEPPMPEMQFEELTDEEYERIMAQAAEAGKKQEEQGGHDEL